MRKTFTLPVVSGLLMLALSAVPALAAPVPFTLVPGPVQVGFRAWGLGLLPIDGRFTRFEGKLILDDADPQACRLVLRAQADSLAMPQQAMTNDAIGPDLLDVANFPEFQLDGGCNGASLAATILLHGVTRPVAMEVELTHGTWRAVATIDRKAWGMGARPMLAGSQVRISVTVALPPGFTPGAQASLSGRR